MGAKFPQKPSVYILCLQVSVRLSKRKIRSNLKMILKSQLSEQHLQAKIIYKKGAQSALKVKAWLDL